MRFFLVAVSVAGLLASVGCGGGGGGSVGTAGCNKTGVIVGQQLRNPVSAFTTDNNGVIISLPQLGTGGAASESGALIFGIGTQANNGITIANGPGNGNVTATILPIDTNPSHAAYAGISTKFNNITYPTASSYMSSVIDSGTSVLLFLDTPTTGIPNCASGSGLYCPSTSPDLLSAINIGANNTPQITTPFTVSNDNAYNNTTFPAFSDIAEPVTQGNPGSGTRSADGFFDWGLPFFYGRNVYTAIQGFSAGGTTGPFYAYNGTVTSLIPASNLLSSNVAPVVVDGGPGLSCTNNTCYIETNVAYTTVTVCAPGTATCQVIDHVAIDTGSVGLRIPVGVLNANLLAALPNVNPATPVAACVQFLDQSYFWGSVRVADVKMGGAGNNSELASSVPIHVMGDPAFPNVPSSCSTVNKVGGGTTTGTEEDTVSALGAKGLIGLGALQYDCDAFGGGNVCTDTNTVPPGTYYTCH